jgi:hypothetical protein
LLILSVSKDIKRVSKQLVSLDCIGLDIAIRII